jgi:hypothetical protein
MDINIKISIDRDMEIQTTKYIEMKKPKDKEKK